MVKRKNAYYSVSKYLTSVKALLHLEHINPYNAKI